jgi:radical SAM protein with 4Fe4S-binding SPASM domain
MPSEPYVIKQSINKASLWKKAIPVLGWLDMELTERCNNNCIHCCINLPAEDLEAKKKELSTDEIKGILRQAVSLGCMNVRFTGGEPLLREDFEELYIFARKQGLKVILFTNATLITPHLTELFARIQLLEKIEVTVYGMKRESYEAVTRTEGSFEAAWRGLNLLLKRKVPFVVKGALLPPNRGEMEAFKAWASTIPWMENQPPSYSMFFDLRSRRDSEEKNRLIKGLRVSPEEGLRVLTRREEEYFTDMREFCSKFMGPPGERVFSCGAGHGCCVDAYGILQPCLPLRHPEAVYNLKSGSLEDALKNFFPRLRETKATNPDYQARCTRCFLKGLCEQCPAKSFREHGTLDTPVDYLCEIAHGQARHLGLLGKDERAWEIIDWRQRVKNLLRRTER